MTWRHAGYALALIASLVVHFAISAFALPDEPETLIKGGELSGIVMAGDAFDNAILAGEQVEAVEALSEEAVEEVVEAAETDVTETVDSNKADQALEETEQEAADTSTEVAEADVSEVQAEETAVSEAQLAEPSPAVSAVPIESVETIVSASLEAIPVPKTSPRQPVLEQKVEKPVTKPKPKAKAKAKPKPKAKLKPKAKSKPKPKAKPKPAKKTTAKKPAKKKKSAGNQGQQRANATRKSGGNSTRANRQAGNAAVSNYPGKVRRKITRTRQKRAGGKGTAHIQFSVSPRGGLAAIRLARSSGNSKVDQAALAHVRRSAPFPKPPSGAQRKFRVPITFRR